MTPVLGVLKFTRLVDQYVGHHYYNKYILSLSHLCLGVEKKIFREIMHLHYMTKDYALAREPVAPRGGDMNFW